MAAGHSFNFSRGGSRMGTLEKSPDSHASSPRLPDSRHCTQSGLSHKAHQNDLQKILAFVQHSLQG